MNRIENYLRDSWLCQLIKVIVVILWIFIPTGFFSGLKAEIARDVEAQRNRDPVEERQAHIELQRFVDKLAEVAAKEGDNYTPVRYFEDLRQIDLKSKSLGVSAGTTNYSQLSQVSYQNFDKGEWQQSEISVEAEKYRYWREENLNGFPEAQAQLKALGAIGVARWFIKFWFVSMPFALIVYLTGMIQRRGILATILAAKGRFVLAIVFWPCFIARYPTNVLREIVVEAELRRLGQLFRRLSGQERQYVQETAGDPNWRGVLTQVRSKNVRWYRHGLALAVLATILCHIAALPARASPRKASPTAVSWQHKQPDDFSGSTTGGDANQSALIPESPTLFRNTNVVVFTEGITLFPNSITTPPDDPPPILSNGLALN